MDKKEGSLSQSPLGRGRKKTGWAYVSKAWGWKLNPRQQSSNLRVTKKQPAGPMQTRAVFCLTHKFCLNSELAPTLKFLNMPGGTTGKEPTRQCRRHKRHRFSPGVGKIPWRRAWQPTPVFLPGEFQGQRSLKGYSP